MKKTPWEKWEVDFLREVAATMPVEVIAEKLERTEKAVMAKATRIGADIVSRLRGRRWTRAEIWNACRAAMLNKEENNG